MWARAYCLLRTIWLTVSYPKAGLFAGLILSGHDFQATGTVHEDHWEITCKRCGADACSEVKP